MNSPKSARAHGSPVRTAVGAMAVLLVAAGALLGACADPDNVAVKQIPEGACALDGYQLYEFCAGGVVYDVNYQGTGAVLVLFPVPQPNEFYKIDNAVSNPPAQNIDDGRQNTGTFNSDHPASFRCQNLVGNGFDDWYLPAINEMLATNAGTESGNLPMIFSSRWWSSTEDGADTTQAWMLDMSFSPPGQSPDAKNGVQRPVMCIRRAKPLV